MHGLSCDRCGKSLLIDEEVRYEARIAVVAAWDPPEVTKEDLDVDHHAEMRRLIAAAEQRPGKELQDEVAVQRVFDLCPPCRSSFLDAPLGAGAVGDPEGRSPGGP